MSFTLKKFEDYKDGLRKWLSCQQYLYDGHVLDVERFTVESVFNEGGKEKFFFGTIFLDELKRRLPGHFIIDISILNNMLDYSRLSTIKNIGLYASYNIIEKSVGEQTLERV